MPAILRRWAMRSFLVMLCGCSATLPQTQCRPDPPPAGLMAEAEAGPDYPDGDTTVGDLLPLIAARESAAAVCRARHRGLSEWARGVTR